jgi:hypothetical protein
MGKLLGIAALALIGVIAFAVFGDALPDTNPLHGLAEGIRQAGRAIVDSVYGVGRGAARGISGG